MRFIFIIMIVCIGLNINSQISITTDNTSSDASDMLDIKSIDRGIEPFRTKHGNVRIGVRNKPIESLDCRSEYLQTKLLINSKNSGDPTVRFQFMDVSELNIFKISRRRSLTIIPLFISDNNSVVNINHSTSISFLRI